MKTESTHIRATVILSLLLCFTSGNLLHGQTTISGKVYDASTGDGLPFATLFIQGTTIGATSGPQGQYELRLESESPMDTLVVSFIGYESVKLSTIDSQQLRVITLSPSEEMLEPVIVRPLTPAQYLTRVQLRLKENQAEYSFNTVSNYEEHIREEGHTIGHNEGRFFSWHKSYLSDAKTHHQLALHRQEKIERLEFMSKKAEKEKKKYLEDHPEEADQFEEDQLFIANFGGPSSLLQMDPSGSSFEILDSTQHKDFDFEYLDESSYMGIPLIVIGYTSRGKVDHRKCTGSIYIDKSTDAVVSIKEEGTFVIPILIRPVLFAIGMSIQSPYYSVELKSRPIEGHWYPQYLLRRLEAQVKKKHLFNKNEVARFEMDQHLSISEISIEGVRDIPEADRFDSSKKMSDQVRAIPGITW